MKKLFYSNGALRSGRRGMSSVLSLVLLSAAIVATGLGVSGAVLFIRPGGGSSGSGAATERRGAASFAFVPFDTVVVNLKGERLTRFLQASISLKVEEEQKRDIENLMEKEKVVFQNWLITHLADMEIKDVEGSSSMRNLQREIEDGFNKILASKHPPAKIEAVLFEEFNVQ